MSDVCDYPGCAITDPHYHRETPDGEEVVRAHAPGSKPDGVISPFAGTVSVIERQNEVLVRLCAMNPGSDLDSQDLMLAIDRLARRIAIDMLESTEFTNHIEAAITTRAFVIAKRVSFDLLASKEFSDRIHTAQKAFIFELTQTAQFRGTVADMIHKWYYDERGKTRPDAERHPDAQIIAPLITDPADVKEEIVEIDNEGNVSAVKSTVHTKPTKPLAVTEEQYRAGDDDFRPVDEIQDSGA